MTSPRRSRRDHPGAPVRRLLLGAAALLPAALALPVLLRPGRAAAQAEPPQPAQDRPRERLRDRLAEQPRGRGQPEGAQAGAHDFAWADPARGRTLPLRLRLPAGEAPAALVLFSHGLGGSVAAGTLWAQAWADSGIATLHLQHPGSDGAVLREGGFAQLRGAAEGEQLVARAADVAFVLDELARRRAAGEPLLQRLRLADCGLAGHSFGARTALAVAGQRFGPRGAALADPRPRAFAAFSPAPPARGDAAQAFGAIVRPVLCLSGTLDGDPLAATARGPLAGAGPGGRGEAGERDERAERTERAERAERSAAGGGAAEPPPRRAGALERGASGGLFRRAVYAALPAGDKAELWLDGADHVSFAGHAAASPLRARAEAAAAGAARHQALIAQVSTRWWQAQLLGDAAARAALAGAPQGLAAGDEWLRG